MPPLPDPRIAYYLRNVFDQRYLYRDTTTTPRTGTNKVEDPTYQWTFVLSGTASDTFFIRNVGNSAYLVATGPINTSYNGYYNVFISSTSSSSWKVIPDGNAFRIEMAISSAHILLDSDDTYVYAATRSFTYKNIYLEPIRYQWYLDPVTPLPVDPSPIVNKNPLPEGFYRIRSFFGSYVLTMSQNQKGTSYTAKQANNDLQKWFVKPESTREVYTISNSGTGLFLAGSASNLVKGATLISQSTAFQWNIQTFGPGVMFFIGLPTVTPKLSIGMPNYEVEDLSMVTLQPSDNIPSQIWFFETFESLSPPIFYADRILGPGDYFIESSQDNRYLAVSTTGFLISQPNSGQATRFTVAYADANTPRFTLSCLDNGDRVYIFAFEDRVELSDRKTDWVVRPLHRESGTVFNVFHSTSTNPRRAISARKEIVRRNTYFALDPIAEQEVMQMWKFRLQTPITSRSIGNTEVAFADGSPAFEDDPVEDNAVKDNAEADDNNSS